MGYKHNNYNELAETYSRSDEKPDKLYSILPTVLAIAGPIEGKTVLDLGCGGGFFAEAFKKNGASTVLGIDHSESQIAIAQKQTGGGISYTVGDIFTDPLPAADIICSPFVLNYANSTASLHTYFQKLFTSVNHKGKVILVYDQPRGQDLKKFGAKKYLTGDKDGSAMTIELYNQNNLICTLQGIYFKETTIIDILKEVGFANITTHQSIISAEGLQKFGKEFWGGYVEQCELGFITAEKI